MNSVLAVICVPGKDQKGVIAQFATYLADRGINIQDIEQRFGRGFFVIDMLVVGKLIFKPGISRFLKRRGA